MALKHLKPVPELAPGTGFARLLTASLVLVVAPAPASFGAPNPDWGTLQPPETVHPDSVEGLGEILGILSSSKDGSHGRSLALAHLVALGPRSVPAIFALLRGTAPIPDELVQNGPLLTDEREALLFDAMRSWDSARVAGRLELELESDSSLGSQLTAVRILGEVGNARSIETFVVILGGIEDVDLAHPGVRKPSVAALASALERDPLCYVVLESVVRDLSPAQVDLLVDAIGGARRAEGLDILESLLGRSPELDERVLQSLGSFGVRELALVGPRVQRLVRPYLTSTHTRSRICAARALGTLKDASSFLELTELLDDPSPGVAKAALDALQAMSGTAWPADATRWRRWYVRERTWLRERATVLSSDLEIGDPEAAMKALRELASHPFFRTEMVNTIGRAVDHESRSVAALACESLGLLSSPEAVDLLVSALYDPRTIVRDAAADSLRRCTGKDLPPEAGAWERWLEG